MEKKQWVVPWKLLFVLVVAMFIMPVSKADAEEFTSGDWSYMVDEEYYDGQVVLTGYTGSANSVSVPESIDGKKVSIIAEGCFSSNSYIEAINFPESITDIEEDAIQNCSNLKKVYIRGKKTNVSSWFMTGSDGKCKVYCYKSLPSYESLKNKYDCSVLDIYVKLNRSSITLNMGRKTTLKAKVYNASNAKVVWSIGNKKIASVSNGRVVAKKSGKTTVTAKYTKNGATYKDTCNVYVNKPYISGSGYIYTTEKVKFRVYNNGTKKPHWTSSNKKVAVINKKGYVRGKKTGSTTIKANVGGVVVSYRVYVYGPSISYSAKDVTVGRQTDLYVYPSYVYGNKVRWSSSNSRIAKVDKNGNIYGRKVGKCTIYAKVAGKKLSCKIAVKKNEYKRSYVSKLSDVSDGYIQWELISAKMKGNKVTFRVKFLNNTSDYCSKLSYLKFNCWTDGVNYGTFEKDGINLDMSSYSVKTVSISFKISKKFRRKMDLRGGSIYIDEGSFQWF